MRKEEKYSFEDSPFASLNDALQFIYLLWLPILITLIYLLYKFY